MRIQKKKKTERVHIRKGLSTLLIIREALEKKRTRIILLAIVSSIVLFMGSHQKKEVDKKIEIKKNYENIKEEKNREGPHKKGIEHIADYQRDIRKGIDEKKSSYKEGYLIKEYKKAIQKKRVKKSLRAITPIFTERGPNNVPGRSRGIAIDPNNTNRWFIGTVGGGVWLTEDAGATWRSLTDFKIPNLATSTIVMSQTDSNVLYVGTGEPFGGLGAIGGSGLFKTIDGGSTWQSLEGTAAFGDVGRIIINPSDDSNVIIATSLGIYRTSDGGATWTQAYNSLGRRVQDLDSNPSNFEIQYGSVYGLGIVKSTNGGVSWTTVLNKDDFNENHSRFEMDVSRVNPSVLVVCAYSSSGGTVSPSTDLYISKNEGETFTNLTAPADAIEDRLDLVDGQGWYDNIVLAHPFNENIFYVGGVELFKVIVNDDNTFTAVEMAATNQNQNLIQRNTNVHVDQHGLKAIIGTDNKFRLVLANDGGVFLSNLDTDSGINDGDWSDLVLGKNSTQFYGAAKQNGFDRYLGGAQDNGCWMGLSDDATASSSYQKAFGGDGFEVLWHYNNPKDFIVTSQNNVIARYINFSYTGFERLEGSPIFYTKITNSDNNPDVVFSVSGDGVWRSTDFAATWNLIPITDNFAQDATSSLNVKVSTADPKIVWAGSAMTESGSFVLHVSEDNGQTFSPASAYDNPNETHDLLISGMATSLTERNRAYALFSSSGVPKILKTEDLGTTWTDITGFESNIDTGFPDVAVHSLLEMPFDKNIIWAGTDIGIFQTENGGTSWSIISEFPSVAAYDMKIVNDQVVIASYGRGIWSATLEELNDYEPPSFLRASKVVTNQKEIQSRKALVNYTATDDKVSRVKVFVDNTEVAEIIQDFNTGVTYSFETADLTEGNHTVAIQLFDDESNMSSVKESNTFSIVDYKPPTSFLQVIDFVALDIYTFNAGFVINNLSNNVSKDVLNNTGHPYADNTTYSVVLKQPLTISESNRTFIYEDFAIVEPYTTDLNDLTKFYDYVIIEASKDLQNWTTLDKYDARRFEDWLIESGKDVDLMNINDALFKKQSIDIKSKGFVDGDEVVLRFSLVTDPGTTSYGWAIRSINTDAVASVKDVLTNMRLFSVYPTVSNGNITVFGKNNLGNSKVQIVDLTGKKVYQNTFDFNQNQKQEISVNLTQGVYILQLIDQNKKIGTQKIIIE